MLAAALDPPATSAVPPGMHPRRKTTPGKPILPVPGRRRNQGITNPCSGWRIVNTGQGAFRTTFSAVPPSSICFSPL